MRSAAGLDDDMAEAVGRVGAADVLVGIPSYRNAATVGHVARAVAEGLRRSFPQMRVAVVNADGGSDDGTPDRAREGLEGVPAVVGRYTGLPGKGSAFRAIFAAAAELGARACAVVDADLRSIRPDWIERLLGPVASDAADFVAPLYARHKHDGTITNVVAYPLTRALYGARVRQPIGGEFGFSGELAGAFLEGGALAAAGQDVWGTDVARFGIDVYMTTTALVRRARVAQAFLGAKVHDPRDPAADLGPMFRQVVGTAFRLGAANADRWRAVHGSRDVPVSGDVRHVEPEAVRADADLLVRRFREGTGEHQSVWDEALSPDAAGAVRRALAEDVPHALAGEPWATIVYDLLAASARSPERTGELVLSLVPLYFGRVAALFADARDLTTSEAERLVDEQALAFERRKRHLEERWTAPAAGGGARRAAAGH